LPPLRERKSDIHLMIDSFIRRYTQPGRGAVRVSGDALRVLENYSWPGNVRELRHTIQRLTVLNSGGVIRLEDIPSKLLESTMPAVEIQATNGNRPAVQTARDGRMMTWAEVEQNYLHDVLRVTHGNKKQAAEIMGIDRKTLSRMVERYRIDLEMLKGNS